MRQFLYVMISSLLFFSCHSGKEGTDSLSLNFKEKRGIYVCNEGNFMYGNASLSYIDLESKVVYNEFFFNVNGFPLGDVCQSMTIHNGKGFVVINNSGKVFVIDVETGKYIGKIAGLTSPRYIRIINQEKAYITDLYSPYITIVNPETLTKTGSVFMGIKPGPGKVNGTEQMVLVDDYLYVTGWSFNNKVYKIDTRKDLLVDSVEVTKQPNSIVADKHKNLWVLSDGGYAGTPYGQEKAALTRISTESFSIAGKFEFPDMNASPSKLCMNGTKDSIFYINGSWAQGTTSGSGVMAMPVEQNHLPETALIPESGRLFYGLTVDPKNSDIYVSDAIDYQQKGWVFRYNSKGEQLDRFKVDIIPGSFCFKEK